MSSQTELLPGGEKCHLLPLKPLRRHNKLMEELVLIKMSKYMSGLICETRMGVNVRQVVFVL